MCIRDRDTWVVDENNFARSSRESRLNGPLVSETLTLTKDSHLWESSREVQGHVFGTICRRVVDDQDLKFGADLRQEVQKRGNLPGQSALRIVNRQQNG